MKVTIDVDQIVDDAFLEVLIDTLPDMTTEELATLEIAVNAELQERSRQMDLFR